MVCENKVEVSVIVPFRNLNPYFNDCMQSLIEQDTNHSFEVILVDDYSDYDVAKKIFEEYSTQRLFRCVKSNRAAGRGGARNFGISVANGDFVMFVDADDTVSPNFVEYALNAILKSNTDYVEFDSFYIFKTRKQYISSDEDFAFQQISCWNKIYKIQVFESVNFFEGPEWYEDLGTIPLLRLLKYSVARLDKPLYFYNAINSSSQTNKLNSIRIADTTLMINHLLGLTSGQTNDIEVLAIKTVVMGTGVIKLRRVTDKSLKRITIKNCMLFMNSNFPNWKSNQYFMREHKKMFLANKIMFQCNVLGMYFGSTIVNEIYSFSKKMKDWVQQYEKNKENV